MKKLKLTPSRAVQLLPKFAGKFTAYGAARAIERIFKEATGIHAPKGATVYEEGVIRNLITSALEALTEEADPKNPNDGVVSGIFEKTQYESENKIRKTNLYFLKKLHK